MPGVGDISVYQYPIVVELVNDIREGIILSTQNDEEADMWDEYEGGVNWIYNELFFESLNDEELSDLVYATSIANVNEAIIRLSKSPYFEKFRTLYLNNV